MLKGILGTSEKYGSAISLGFRIAGTLHGLYALQAIIDNVHEQLIIKLTSIDQDSLTTNLLLEQHLKEDKENARLLSSKLASEGIDITSIAKLDENSKYELKAKLNVYKQTNEKVGSFLLRFLDELVAVEETYFNTLSMIIKSVSDRITEQIVRIIDSQLVSPWSTYAVSMATDKLSQAIQHHCFVDKNQNTNELNEDQKKYNYLINIEEYSTMYLNLFYFGPKSILCLYLIYFIWNLKNFF